MPLSAQQARFVQLHLGMSPPGPSGVAVTGTHQAPIRHWQLGKETADKGIAALQQALKGFDHPDLKRIADYGLNGATEGQQTALTAALMDYSAAAPDKRARAADNVTRQVAAYRGFLDSSDVIRLCENNPFGIAVDIRGPLRTALDRIETELAG